MPPTHRDPLVVLAATDHGLGHATRCAAVARALVARGVAVAFRSSAPASVFEGLGPVMSGPTDVGLVQTDAVSMDLTATRARWDDWIARWPALVREEAARLRALGADLVVADVPPLAIDAAASLGIPAIALGNFGWDWILARFARARGDAALLPAAHHVASIYARADHLLRLPLSEPMRAFRSRESIGLVARLARSTRAATRRQLGLSDDTPIALISFGGGGIGPLDVASLVADAAGFVFLAPGQRDSGDARVRALGFDEYFHPDLVAAADVVVTKPGYGIVAECLAHGRPMLYVLRGDFPEQPILARAIGQKLAGRRTTVEAVRAGRIGAALRGLVEAGRDLVPCEAVGADEAADRIAALARDTVRARRA